MSTSIVTAGLRKRISDQHVRVLRRVVRDTRISFRALGILAWLLDRPDGWVVRAEQISREGQRPDGTTADGTTHAREGREAVRTALRELAAAGYYRLERRRMRDGSIAMGNAVADEPVPSWAEQWQVFDGKAVPVVEQPDGTFLVRYPDGTLQPDDWPAPDPAASDKTAAQTGDRFSGPGGTGAVLSGPGFPAPGEPAPDNTAPLDRKEVKVIGEEVPPYPHASVGESTPQTTINPAQLVAAAEPGLTPPRRLLVDLSPSRACGRVHGDELSCRLCKTNPRAKARKAAKTRLAQQKPCDRGHTGQLAGSCSVCAGEAKGVNDLLPAQREPGQLSRPWCGQCDADTRRVTSIAGNGRPFTLMCPTCRPLPASQAQNRRSATG